MSSWWAGAIRSCRRSPTFGALLSPWCTPTSRTCRWGPRPACATGASPGSRAASWPTSRGSPKRSGTTPARSSSPATSPSGSSPTSTATRSVLCPRCCSTTGTCRSPRRPTMPAVARTCGPPIPPSTRPRCSTGWSRPAASRCRSRPTRALRRRGPSSPRWAASSRRRWRRSWPGCCATRTTRRPRCSSRTSADASRARPAPRRSPMSTTCWSGCWAFRPPGS